MSSGYEELFSCESPAVVDAAVKCRSVFETHEHALVSVSGGADSDVMVDLCERVRQVAPIDITYVFFDTGVEFKATKGQLDYLEGRYSIHIERRRAVKTIPVCCREFGLPFVSKMVSHHIAELQAGGFGFDDLPTDELAEMYPDVNYSSLKWWNNQYQPVGKSAYNIGRNTWLREFLIESPPDFPISDKCCLYAKKLLARDFLGETGADLNVVGVRRAEGGVRSTIDQCFSSGQPDTYRPLFWMRQDDRAEYEHMFGIRHSDCYEVWGYTRTGCVGCPFNRDCMAELEVAESYEPNLSKAARSIFGRSYEYTAAYREFQGARDAELRETDEYRQKVESRVAKTRKRVEQVDGQGNVVATFASESIAAIETGVAQSAISRVVHGYRKSAGGYVWRFSD